MPDVRRCLDLIRQADGPMSEKLECARMGLWGNIPNFVWMAGSPSQVISFTPREFEIWSARGDNSVRKCGGNCGCGGNNGGSPGLVYRNQDGLQPATPAGGGGISGGVYLGQSSINATFGLGLLLVVAIVIGLRKGR